MRLSLESSVAEMNGQPLFIPFGDRLSFEAGDKRLVN